MKVPPARIQFTAADRAAIAARVDEILGSGQLTLGKYGKEFEAAFARLVGVPHAVAVNSGTSSIEIPLRVLGVEGRDVLVPTNTFMATCFGVLHAGGRVRFVETDPETFGVSPAGLAAARTKDTAGVIVVHIGGIVSPRLPEIRAWCDREGLFLFEDAAHAHGCAVNGRAAGSFGQAASFSFYPTKVITSGEGGMIVTSDPKLDQEARLYRDQGKQSFTANLHGRCGYNWRMSELHAVVGLQHFSHLEEFIEERQAVARRYDEGLRGIRGIRALPVPSGCRSNFYKYLALLDPGLDRAALKKRLREDFDIGLSGEVYEVPCHLQPLFDGKYPAGSFPVAEDLCRRHICLPVYNGMTGGDTSAVLEALGTVLGRR
ncbi:MAG: DegT/DnrJ/EryC1/StrS family aminotransferase [Planctomycetes bacterium]|nr:DegT/DnrJ/EryC1/StrS family aminotransferase [Planctomycetota bacterium]